jgi:hypothetical protein
MADYDGDVRITLTEHGSRGNALRFSRKAGDRVLVSILGPRGGTRAVVELTPGMVSQLVQGLISEEMHLTVAMLDRIRAREDAWTRDGGWARHRP